MDKSYEWRRIDRVVTTFSRREEHDGESALLDVRNCAEPHLQFRDTDPSLTRPEIRHLMLRVYALK
jgi:hypothetical protein